MTWEENDCQYYINPQYVVDMSVSKKNVRDYMLKVSMVNDDTYTMVGTEEEIKKTYNKILFEIIKEK